jgi:hypothetical protein
MRRTRTFLASSTGTRTLFAVFAFWQTSCASDDAASRMRTDKSAPTAPAEVETIRAEVREIIERSGLGTKLMAASRVAEFFVGNMRETARRIGADDEEAAAMIDNLTHIALHSAGPAYESERLLGSIEREFMSAPTEVRRRALEHYRDPRADRTALVYAELATPAGQHRLSRFLGEVRTGEIDPTKVLVIEGMLGASQEVELTVTLAFDTSSSFLIALEPALPKAIREPKERLLARRTAFETSAKRQLTMQHTYVYSALDDADLQAEARFWASPEGRAFSDLRVRAANRALENAEREATEKVREALETMKREAPHDSGEPPIDA